MNWLCIVGMWLPFHFYVQRERSIDCALLASDCLFIFTFSEKDQLTMHSWQVIAFSFLRSARKINWRCILIMWLPFYGYVQRERSIDCAFLLCVYLFIVMHHKKVKLTVHCWHVIIFSSLSFANKINRLCIIGMWLRLHRYVSRERSINCAFLACDYLFIVTFCEKDWLWLLGMWLPFVVSFHHKEQMTQSLACELMSTDTVLIVKFTEKCLWIPAVGFLECVLVLRLVSPCKQIDWAVLCI